MAEPHSSDDDQAHAYHAKPSEDDEWSSDSDVAATAAGYTLLQNESGSDEDSSYFAPHDESDDPQPSALDEPLPLASEETPWMPFKMISPEEEARLREEAFAQFDRNYQSVCRFSHSISTLVLLLTAFSLIVGGC